MKAINNIVKPVQKVIDFLNMVHKYTKIVIVLARTLEFFKSELAKEGIINIIENGE